MIYVYFLSETSHQDGDSSKRQPYIKTEPTDTLKHEITEAVMIALDRHETNRTTQLPPVDTISPDDKDSTNDDCVLLEVQISTGTRIPDPPFSSFGPSHDYGMDLCLEVYL